MKLIVLVSLASTLGLIATPIVAHAQDRSYTAGSGSIPTDPARLAAATVIMKQYSTLRAEAVEHIRKGEKKQAIEVIEKMLTIRDYFSLDRVELAVLYTSSHKPNDVIRMLRPIIYHGPNSAGGDGADPGVRMLFVLALLDTHEWEEAVAVYEPTINSNPHWQLVGGGPEHAFPNIHFTVNTPDYEAMRAQAHLILGARLPTGANYAAGPTDLGNEEREYMLEHLKQSIRYNAQSSDAHFVSTLILRDLGSYDQARTELASAARYAPDTTQPEIRAALKDLTSREEQQRAYEASKAAHAAAKQEGSVQP